MSEKLHDPELYYFDEKAADKAVYFMENYCTLISGPDAGKPVKLLDWQRDKLIRPLFGWKRKKDGLRKYRKVFLEIPARNGKTWIGAAIALYLLIGDGEAGAQVIGAAGSREQAGLVFSAAKDMASWMINAHPDAGTRLEVKDKVIRFKDHAGFTSFFRTVSADASSVEGIDAHGIIFDEIHVQQKRFLYDALMARIGSRKQPVVIGITTAGWNRETICYELYKDGKNVLQKRKQGIDIATDFLPIIYEADRNDSWDDSRTWKKANPSYGIGPTEDYLKGRVEEAKRTPAKLNSFLRYNLNIWTSNSVQWIPFDTWEKNKTRYTDQDLAKVPCVIGVDLASTQDLTAIVACFKMPNGDFVFRPHFFMPNNRIDEREREDGTPFVQWRSEGHLYGSIQAGGDVVDYDEVEELIEELCKKYRVRKIIFDRKFAQQLITNLIKKGYNVEQLEQSIRNYSPICKEFERLLIQGKIDHSDNPVMEWCAQNVMVDITKNGDYFPRKPNEKSKIDGIVGALMGLSDWVINPDLEEQGLSVFALNPNLKLTGASKDK